MKCRRFFNGSPPPSTASLSLEVPEAASPIYLSGTVKYNHVRRPRARRILGTAVGKSMLDLMEPSKSAAYCRVWIDFTIDGACLEIVASLYETSKLG